MSSDPSTPHKEPSLQDIADATGLSRMAVSLALRNRPGVKAETRNRVLEVAKALGYRPNPLVSAYQAQVRSRRPTRFQANLAWINDHPEADFWRNSPWAQDYLDGARARAAMLGYGLEEFHHPATDNASGRQEAARLRVLHHRGIQGVLLPWLHEPGTVRKDWAAFSVVMIGENVCFSGRQLVPSEAPLFHYVTPDSYYNLQMAWTRLRDRGLRRIGLALNHLNDALVDSRQQARLQILQQSLAQDERVPALLIPDANSSTGQRAFRLWTERYRLDAVMLFDESLVLELDESVRSGLTVVQLNRFRGSDAPFGVDTRRSEIAAAAVDLVVAQLIRNEKGRTELPWGVSIRGRWFEKEAPTA